MDTGPLVYLCGAINGCSDSDCTDWRKSAAEHLPRTLDPMRRDYRGIEHMNADSIVEGDKKDIDLCDVLLVKYNTPSVGTIMEILYAWERGKRVVIVTNVDNISPWLIYHSHHIVSSFDEAYSIIGGTYE